MLLFLGSPYLSSHDRQIDFPSLIIGALLLKAFVEDPAGESSSVAFLVGHHVLHAVEYAELEVLSDVLRLVVDGDVGEVEVAISAGFLVLLFGGGMLLQDLDSIDKWLDIGALVAQPIDAILAGLRTELIARILKLQKVGETVHVGDGELIGGDGRMGYLME